MVGLIRLIGLIGVGLFGKLGLIRLIGDWLLGGVLRLSSALCGIRIMAFDLGWGARWRSLAFVGGWANRWLLAQLMCLGEGVVAELAGEALAERFVAGYHVDQNRVEYDEFEYEV